MKGDEVFVHDTRKTDGKQDQYLAILAKKTKMEYLFFGVLL